MRRRTVFSAALFGTSDRSRLAPLLLGLAIWVGFPTVVARQDIIGLIAGLEAPGATWSAYIEKAAAGSTHQAELPFAQGGELTGAISGAGLNTPAVGMIAFRGKAAAIDALPDEARVVRKDKRGRIAKIVRMAPPKAFTAGSILDRQSLLFSPTAEAATRMAFAKPAIKGREIEIAENFHPKAVTKPGAGLPTMLASLVTSDHADVLATAYASPEPDYEKKSPFETLLKDQDPNAGRFVPPIEPGDHAWVGEPLPPEVFSPREQQCLAAAVYFEARGEPVKGQAAVAQVVLNRVRNPEYPKTICGVVYQNEDWRNACQFSFACDGIRDRVVSPEHWRIAEEVAMAVTAGKIWLPEIGSSTHYHATYVHPRWARAMEVMERIGRHIFYRTYNGGWD